MRGEGTPGRLRGKVGVQRGLPFLLHSASQASEKGAKAGPVVRPVGPVVQLYSLVPVHRKAAVSEPERLTIWFLETVLPLICLLKDHTALQNVALVDLGENNKNKFNS